MNPTLLLIAAAILLDLILGDPSWLTHPVTIIGKVVENGEVCCKVNLEEVK